MKLHSHHNQLAAAGAAIVCGFLALAFAVTQASHEPMRVLFLGDIMLDRGVEAQIKKVGFETMFGEFRKGLDGYDLVIANLEGPFSERRENTRYLSFRFDPALAPKLRWLGLDAVSLANNHTLNMGAKNLAGTRKLLGDNGISYFGDPWDVNAWSAHTVLVRGKRIALVGFNTTFGTLKTVDMVAKVKEVRPDADYVVVMMHWGTEYKTIHNATQEKLAHSLIDAGADAIIGAHPHVVQDTEVYKKKPIAYSLGNFIFDQYFSAATQKGMAAELVMQGGDIKLETTTFTSKKSVPTWD